jgi:hypothetical protein
VSPTLPKQLRLEHVALAFTLIAFATTAGRRD